MNYAVTFVWEFLDVRSEDGRRLCMPEEVTLSTLVTPDLPGILRNPTEIKVVAQYNHCYYDLFTWTKPEHVPVTQTANINPSFRLNEEQLDKLSTSVV
jgi:hypothetical protein